MISNLQRLKRNKHILHVLKDAKPKLRKAILSNVGNDVIKTINEIAYNTLHNNNPLSDDVKLSLKRYKKSLRCLSCQKRSLASKKKVLLQHGNGFLPILIGTVLSGIIGNMLNRE